MTLNFSIENNEVVSLSTPALVFVEGVHKDSRGREHVFSSKDIETYVNNTNHFLAKGGKIPWQKDHQKTQDYNIGEVQSSFVARPISKDDIKDPAYNHLIGRTGVFVDKLVGKGAQVVQDIKDKKISTLSPGLDPHLKQFIEVSATPLPAIIGPSLLFSINDKLSEVDNIIYFSEDYRSKDSQILTINSGNIGRAATKSFSFEALDQNKKNLNELQLKYRELSDGLFKILSDLSIASEEELQGLNPIEASYNALQIFVEKTEEMFDLTEDEGDEKDNRLNYLANPTSIGRTKKASFEKRLNNLILFSKSKKGN